MTTREKQFEALVNDLQHRAMEDARRTFGDKGFQRWLQPKYHRPLDNPDASARVCGSCGDSIEIFLRFKDNRVAEAAYATDGCGSSALCGSFTAELAHGKNPEEIMALTPQDVLHTIGRFPDQDKHCAKLAVMALHKALNDYLVGRVPENKWITSSTSRPGGETPK